jgi:LysM repeat protein
MMLDENAPLERKRREALKVYFAEENDNVWDIARDNNASVDEIMQINGLSEDTFKSRKMILIPII